MSEGQQGGEFFTPSSIVRLIVEIIEPFGGKILEPACGSGGMFVQCDKFRWRQQNNDRALSLYGQEKVEKTGAIQLVFQVQTTLITSGFRRSIAR